MDSSDSTNTTLTSKRSEFSSVGSGLNKQPEKQRKKSVKKVFNSFKRYDSSPSLNQPLSVIPDDNKELKSMEDLDMMLGAIKKDDQIARVVKSLVHETRAIRNQMEVNNNLFNVAVSELSNKCKQLETNYTRLLESIISEKDRIVERPHDDGVNFATSQKMTELEDRINQQLAGVTREQQMLRELSDTQMDTLRQYIVRSDEKLIFMQEELDRKLAKITVNEDEGDFKMIFLKNVDYGPTVFDYLPFEPHEDAKDLRKALKGVGLEEDTVIKIMTQRSIVQRRRIDKEYKNIYGRGLIAEMKSELSGKFLRLMLYLIKTPAEHDADEIRDAVKGLGTDETALIDIICTRVNEEIVNMKEIYELKYKKGIERDVRSDTSGTFRKVLLACLLANRTSNKLSDDSASDDAEVIVELATQKRMSVEDNTFIELISTNNFAHIREMNRLVEKSIGKDILDLISQEFSGYAREAMETIVKCAIHGRVKTLAERLNNCLKGNLRETQLTRLIVSRSSLDLALIKKEIQKNGYSVEERISNQTSGSYRKALMSLTKGNSN